MGTRRAASSEAFTHQLKPICKSYVLLIGAPHPSAHMKSQNPSDRDAYHINAHINDAYVDNTLMYFDTLGTERFLTFIGDSVVARLGETEFVASLTKWMEILGAARFVTLLSSNSVASRIQIPEFVASLTTGWRFLGPVAS